MCAALATVPRSARAPRRAWFVLPPRVHMLDLGGPLQLIASLAPLRIAAVQTCCIGADATLDSHQGLRIANLAPLPERVPAGDWVIVIGSKHDFRAPPSAEYAQLVSWLRRVVAPQRERIVLAGVCTGAFLLGAAGLLDGQACTTHHAHLTRLQQRHPEARVLANRLLVDEGALLTSAGVAAGIDLALHLIARQFGAAAAIEVARENVVPFRRMSGDAALDAQLRYRDHDHELIHAVQDFLVAEPACSLSYTELAGRFALSYRHLARRFRDACGITLKAYHQQLRIARARQLLRDSDAPVERIAEQCGFASVQAFRSAWRQIETLSPSAWRAA
ncbi:GlxA family transcriptional regulator [Burkholderia gladioli]|uniref:GlxA family transcriptional regulator n=1 Tax=Burkholderia gladioli TaxID=28095 RepID=UPI001FC8794F|nr:helix-turn-helix domain-containing protein [Burkholderia gladioli]